MTKPVHRLGDADAGGGAVTGVPQGTVFVNNLLVSVNGSSVSDHGRYEHDAPVTANGSSTVFIAGIPVNRQGDADTCGHPRSSGSPDVFVGP